MEDRVKAPEAAPGFRCGLAVLVGRTNAGKSTLLNALVGSKVSIVTPKPQTTREAVQGVVNRAEGQIVFVDTPGFFKTHASALVESLHRKARQALSDVDVVVHVADPSRPLGAEDEMVIEALREIQQPKILCLSKKDLKKRPHRKAWVVHFPAYAEVLDVSAVSKNNLKRLCRTILRHLPVGHALYPPEQTSNVHRDFQIGEIIREKVYLLTQDEVPYRTAVEMHGVEERLDAKGQARLDVKASLLAANERYQRMLIGAQGQMIQRIGTAARIELEQTFARKVFLDLDVMVSQHAIE